MNTKVYVDNLAVATTESELTELFSAYGNVVAVNITIDRANHKPSRSGFVTMVTPEGARAAIQALNGTPIGSGTLIASEGWVNEEYAGRLDERRTPRRRASQLY